MLFQDTCDKVLLILLCFIAYIHNLLSRSYLSVWPRAGSTFRIQGIASAAGAVGDPPKPALPSWGWLTTHTALPEGLLWPTEPDLPPTNAACQKFLGNNTPAPSRALHQRLGWVGTKTPHLPFLRWNNSEACVLCCLLEFLQWDTAPATLTGLIAHRVLGAFPPLPHFPTLLPVSPSSPK